MKADPLIDTRLADAEVLHGIIDAIPHPIFVKDEDSRFVIVNEAMCRFMGRALGELVGHRDADFVPEEIAAIYMENDRRVLRDGQVHENEEPFTTGAGEQRTVVTRKARIEPAGRPPLLIGCITDISDFRRAEAAIRYHAEHDHLTGIANRALFTRRLQEAVQSVTDAASSAALLLIDLDGFKDVNDTMGHAIGDNVLVQVANALHDLVGTRDDVARLGGDEFAVLQPPSRQPGSATELARAVVKRLAEPLYVGGKSALLSASVGVAFACDSEGDPEGLLRRADQALYAAKRGGRNCWRVFDGGLGGEVAA